MSCKYEEECANFPSSCFQCFSYKLFKEKKQKQGIRARSLTNKQKKEGIDFENKGVKKYNDSIKVAQDVARRQIGSGAFGSLYGDMVTEEAITASISEFKERGELDARGRKQITIKKDWLDELKYEASESQKDFYFLPFRFKGEEDVYVTLEYDMLLKYIQTIQILNIQNKELIKQLKEKGAGTNE